MLSFLNVIYLSSLTETILFSTDIKFTPTINLTFFFNTINCGDS